jgi:hypothetical protein
MTKSPKQEVVIRSVEAFEGDQEKGAIPTEGAEPVKRSGLKLVIA